MQNFALFTTWCRLKLFISGAIESKVNKGLLNPVHVRIQLLSLNVPQCRLLQAYCNIKTPSLLIFAPICTLAIGRDWV